MEHFERINIYNGGGAQPQLKDFAYSMLSLITTIHTNQFTGRLNTADPADGTISAINQSLIKSNELKCFNDLKFYDKLYELIVDVEATTNNNNNNIIFTQKKDRFKLLTDIIVGFVLQLTHLLYYRKFRNTANPADFEFIRSTMPFDKVYAFCLKIGNQIKGEVIKHIESEYNVSKILNPKTYKKE